MEDSPNPSVSAKSFLDGRAVLTIWQDGEMLQTLAGMVGDLTTVFVGQGREV